MSVKASEISDLIKQRIEKFSSATEARNVGTVVSVTDGITRIHGLAHVRYGEMIEYPGGVFGLRWAPKSTRSFAASDRKCGVISTVLFLLIKVTIGLRPGEEQEREGLDVSSHGERAYNF